MRYNIVNRDEIPEDLTPGTYVTSVVDAYFEKGELIIDLKFIPGKLPDMHIIKLIKGGTKSDGE